MACSEAAALPKAGFAAALDKAGFDITTGPSRLLLILDGFRPVLLDGVRHGAHEQEVWVRDSDVVVKFIGKDVPSIKGFLEKPLPVSQTVLHRRVVKDVLRQVATSDFEVAVL